jgi:thioredoxin reductase
MELYDVIIVGGGPAGLSAALVLARCRRNILLFDTGKPRNIYSDKMNGFLSRDGINPSEFISIARQDIAKYNVKWLKEEIIKGEKSGDVFKVRSANGKIFQSKKLLMATGIVDNLPPIEDIDKFYGKSIHHCPYCDGYENREKKIAIIGEGKSGIELTKTLSIWSKNLVFFTNGKKLEYKGKKIIAEMNIPVVSQKIIKCIGKDTQIEHLELENGEKIECNTVFLNTNPTQHCKLSDQ